ncbi:MAG: response regulator [Christensenellales bacterium]|jgi:two-component system response regulator YesN
MLKVIIVDDEYLIRDSMISIIPWRENGFEVIGKAKDGREALSLIAANPPDLIISDIRMPNMTGLELLEEVKAKYPKIFFISISGFDDFEYAQKSLNLGASAYILKPIDPAEVVTVLQRIKESILFSKEIVLNKRNVVTNIYFDLILGNFTIEKYFEYANILDSLNNQYFCVISIVWSNYTQSVSDLQLVRIMECSDILNKLVCLVSEQNAFLSLSPDKKIIILKHDNSAGLEKNLSELIASLEEALSKHFTQKFSIGVGKIHFGLFDMTESYFESVKALSLVYLKGHNKVLHYNESFCKVNTFFPVFLAYEEKIINHMRSNDTQSMQLQIATLARQAIDASVSSYDIQLFIRNLLYKAINCLVEANVTVEDVIENPNRLFASLYSENDASTLFELLLTTLGKIGDALCGVPMNTNAVIISQAKQYIQNNFTKYKLSLAEVASHVNLHPAYFSTVFSKCENISFIDYLTSFRLEKAKKLLQNSHFKTTCIANEVGYQNPTYFSTLFKKHVGISPSEYRNRRTQPESSYPSRLKK